MNIRTKIGACLGAFAMGLALAISAGAPQAAAVPFDSDGNNIPDYLGESGWWNRIDPADAALTSDDDGEDRHTYEDFPIKCNNDPAAHTYQVVWVTETGYSPTLLDNNIGTVRDFFRSAASIFAASNKTVITNQTTLGQSRAPRFVTWENASGVCNVLIERVQMSAADIATGSWKVYSNLQAMGPEYTKANTKYLVVIDAPGITNYNSSANLVGSYSDPSIETNRANYHTYLSWVIPTRNIQYLNRYGMGTIAHEMAHSLGAVHPQSPNYNSVSSNWGHAGDCFDLLCYNDGTAGETYLSSCGYGGAGVLNEAKTSRAVSRLDCNSNDYWSPTKAAWSTSVWTLDKSSFLWGNPQPVNKSIPANVGVDRVVENRHPQAPLPREHSGHEH